MIFSKRTVLYFGCLLFSLGCGHNTRIQEREICSVAVRSLMNDFTNSSDPRRIAFLVFKSKDEKLNSLLEREIPHRTNCVDRPQRGIVDAETNEKGVLIILTEPDFLGNKAELLLLAATNLTTGGETALKKTVYVYTGEWYLHAALSNLSLST
jgi:hypothetical protein